MAKNNLEQNSFPLTKYSLKLAHLSGIYNATDSYTFTHVNLIKALFCVGAKNTPYIRVERRGRAV